MIQNPIIITSVSGKMLPPAIENSHLSASCVNNTSNGVGGIQDFPMLEKLIVISFWLIQPYMVGRCVYIFMADILLHPVMGSRMALMKISGIAAMIWLQSVLSTRV